MSGLKPVLVAADAISYSFICDECSQEKNGWAEGATLEAVRAREDFPLGTDKLWVKCDNGHESLVLRDGTDDARSFL